MLPSEIAVVGSPAPDERAMAAASAVLLAERNRLLALNRLSNALSAATSGDQVGEIAVTRAVDVLGASGGAFFLLSDDRHRLVLAKHGRSGAPDEGWEEVSVHVDAPIGLVVRTNTASLQGSVQEIAHQFPALVELAERLGEQAWATFPVVRPSTGEVAGALTFSFVEPATFDDSELALFQSIVGHVATALDRAMLYDAERSSRLQLQEAVTRLQRVEEVVNIALGPVNTPDLLAELLRRATVALAGDSAMVLELDAARGVLVEMASVGLGVRPEGPVELPVDNGFAAEITERLTVFTATELSTATLRPVRLIDPKVRTVVGAPLRHDGTVLGTLNIGFHTDHVVSETDRQIVVAICERVSLVLVNIRLFEAERRSRKSADLLRAVAASLASAVTVAEVANVMVNAAPVAVGARAGGLALAVSDEHIQIVASTRGPAADATRGLLPLTMDNPIGEAVLGRTPVFVDGRRDLEARYPLSAQFAVTLPGKAWAVLPFGVGETDRGAWLLAFDEPGRFAELGGTIEGLAALCAQALTRARRQESDRRTATVLQAALTVPLPSPAPPLRADAVYLLADADITIGGDWYDLVPVGDDGNLMMIVGDVVGSGVRAAATMGQLRAASHALAPRSSAVEILTGLDAFVASHPNAVMATVACIYVDVARGTATISLAGHPPPLVIGPGGDASFADVLPGPPLGVTGHRGEVTIAFGEGSSVALYTDGLVERRGESIDVGLDRLRSVATDIVSGRPPGEFLAGFANGLAEVLVPSSRHDDVAVLVVSNIS